jgi:hypothetical protein
MKRIGSQTRETLQEAGVACLQRITAMGSSKNLENQPIADWLANHNARQLAETKAPDGMLRWYSVGGKMLIVHYYSNGDGWEVYIPASISNRVDATLDTLDKYLIAAARETHE